MKKKPRDDAIARAWRVLNHSRRRRRNSSSRPASEDQSHREFQLTRRRPDCHPGNDPGARAMNATASWICRIDVVEDIEGIHTELGADVLTNRSVLQCGEVGIEVQRARLAVARASLKYRGRAGKTVRSSSRLGQKQSRQGVRPRAGCSVEEVRFVGIMPTVLSGMQGPLGM